MELETRISGAKKTTPRAVAVTVRPVRMSKTEQEMRRVKKPTSWVEFGAWSWSLLRNMEALWVWAEMGWRSAMDNLLIKSLSSIKGVCEREGEREVLKKGDGTVDSCGSVLFLETCRGTRGGMRV
jgi:hypothetical protein